jgi:hypothetical protein
MITEMLIDRLIVEEGHSDHTWVSYAALDLEFPDCDVASFDEDEFLTHALIYIDRHYEYVLSTDYASVDYYLTDEEGE